MFVEFSNEWNGKSSPNNVSTEHGASKQRNDASPATAATSSADDATNVLPSL